MPGKLATTKVTPNLINSAPRGWRWVGEQLQGGGGGSSTTRQVHGSFLAGALCVCAFVLTLAIAGAEGRGGEGVGYRYEDWDWNWVRV